VAYPQAAALENVREQLLDISEAFAGDVRDNGLPSQSDFGEMELAIGNVERVLGALRHCTREFQKIQPVGG
jgi:hypothetical protein